MPAQYNQNLESVGEITMWKKKTSLQSPPRKKVIIKGVESNKERCSVRSNLSIPLRRQPGTTQFEINKYNIIGTKAAANHDPPSTIVIVDENGNSRKWKGPVSPSSLDMHLKSNRDVVAIRWQNLIGTEEKNGNHRRQLENQDGCPKINVQQQSQMSLDDAAITRKIINKNNKNATIWKRYWKKFRSQKKNCYLNTSNIDRKSCIYDSSNSTFSLGVSNQLLKQHQLNQQLLKNDVHRTPLNSFAHKGSNKNESHMRTTQVDGESRKQSTEEPQPSSRKSEEYTKSKASSRSPGGKAYPTQTMTKTSSTRVNKITQELQLLMEPRFDKPASAAVKKKIIPAFSSYMPQRRKSGQEQLQGAVDILQREHSHTQSKLRGDTPKPNRAEDVSTSTADIAACMDKSCNTPGQSYFSPSFAERNCQCVKLKQSKVGAIKRRPNQQYPSGFYRNKNNKRHCDDHCLQ